MSKKTKWSIIGLSALLITMIALSLLTIFVWAKPKTKKIKLETPTLEFMLDGNKKLIIADNNLSANGYAFYVYDGLEPDNVFDYIEHKTEKGKFYLDVSDICTQAKTYYFYCKCLGDDNIEESNISEKISFENKFDLEKAQLAINGTELSWTNVQNASSYKIYMNNVLQTQTTEKKYDIAQAINNKLENNFDFYVVAVGSEYYFDSEKSNIVSYDKTIYSLDAVQNFTIKEAQKKLFWSSVENADKYEVIVNGTQSYFVNSTSYDFSSLLVENGVYTFKIRAVKDDDLFSSFTSIVSYKKTEQLKSVGNITAQKDTDAISNEQKVIFSWSAVSNAINYKLIVKINGIESSIETISTTSIVLYRNGASSISIEVIALGHDYYTDSVSSTKTVNY